LFAKENFWENVLKLIKRNIPSFFFFLFVSVKKQTWKHAFNGSEGCPFLEDLKEIRSFYFFW